MSGTGAVVASSSTTGWAPLRSSLGSSPIAAGPGVGSFGFFGSFAYAFSAFAFAFPAFFAGAGTPVAGSFDGAGGFASTASGAR